MDLAHYEHDYRRRVNLRVLAILTAHIPLVAGVAAYQQTPILPVLGWTAFTLLLPWLFLRLQPETRATSRVIAVAAMFLSAILIHAARGASEGHFHVFVILSVLIVLADSVSLLLAGATIAAHHILFFFLWPASVFDYAAGFEIVLIHAAFVVGELIPACLLARQILASTLAQGLALGELSGHSAHLNEQAQSLSSVGRQLAETANEQADAINQSAALLRQHRIGVEQVAQTATESRKLADDAAIAMAQSEEGIRSLDERLNHLVREAAAVRAIASAVDQIAFQTNLLALNAAVEAARAGEAGAGFSVVAGEVRSLALRSAESAAQAGEKLQVILEQTQDARRFSTGMRESICRVVAADEALHKHIGTLAESSDEQRRQLEATQRHIDRLQELARGGTATAEQSSAAAAEIRNSAGTLDDMVGHLASLAR
jgi:methyl-accepting chemotaxis protein